MFLDQTKENLSYNVISIVDGREIKLKLTSMGIYPNVTITIIKNDHFGPLIIAIKASRISLGRGLSKKIKVEEK